MELKKIGEIDGIGLFVCPVALGWTIGYTEADIFSVPIEKTCICNCEKCKKYLTPKTAGKQYSDIRFVIGNTDNIVLFQKKLDQYKKYLS